MPPARAEKVSCHEVIRGVVLRVPARAGESREVENDVHVAQQRGKRVAVAKVRVHDLCAEIVAIHAILRDDAQIPFPAKQFLDEVASDEAGSSGDKCFHDVLHNQVNRVG